MGLAPFGDYSENIPKQKKTYIDVFRDIIYQTSPLNYKINLDYISYHKKRDVWISEKFTSIFGPKREYGGKITKKQKAEMRSPDRWPAHPTAIVPGSGPRILR